MKLFLPQTFQLLVLTLLSTRSSVTEALPEYAERIPNGYTVPNPGPQGGVWAGVGHVNAGGGGERNDFGLDFAAQGHFWTDELCLMDSDGDGRSNGVELGDPNCVWFQGGPEPEGPTLSHPGIVDEPIDLETSKIVDHCEDYQEPEEVEFWEIGFSTPNQVDETQTHYICEQQRISINVPQQPYHLIKTSAIVDNPNLLHHMFFYLCAEDEVPSDGDRTQEGAYDCAGRTENRCERIGSWAVGPLDMCYPYSVGHEIDLTGRSNVIIKIEAHYDNAIGIPQSDKSSMKFHLTPDLRPLRSSSVMLGIAPMDRDFEIPANQSAYELSNICPSEATRLLDHAIYAYSFFPHMHLFGKQLYTEHWRCGQKIGEIGRIDQYEFDNQQSYGLGSPVKIIPGDALVTKCFFDTTTRSDPVRGGEETTDEMCLNGISFYPHAGTETNPDLFSNYCLSVLNGLYLEPSSFLDMADFGRQASANANLLDQVEGIRMTIVEPSQSGILLDFEEDPSQSWAECCDLGNCDEMYISELGGPCAQDDDCEGALTCGGGICFENNEEALSDGPPSEEEAEEPTASSAVTCPTAIMTMMAAVAAVVVTLV